MCGLAGFLDPRQSAGDAALRLVGTMAGRLVHRGPDSAGAWAEGAIALGHQRLSILDLSAAGNQPMHSSCGRFVIAFNGEIYNHLELRRDLAQAGSAPAWQGHSDTETLLAAVAAWGIESALQRCNGMFALALWDRRAATLHLARDRMGEKPLYWGWAGRALVFGSELKALRAHPDFDPAICRGALTQYMRFGYVPAPRSIYAAIFKLEPGTILTVLGAPPATPPKVPLEAEDTYGSITVARFWSLSAALEAGVDAPIVADSEAVALLETTLARSVKRQMLADVPLGAFLSGGIDSSAIVALMQAQSSQPIRTFTVGFDDAAFDESIHAAAVARHLGTDHSVVRVTAQDARAIIPDLPVMYDEPFADSSQIPTHLVCRAAHGQVAVALSGDGGDELFGGYNRYLFGPRLWQRLSGLPFGMRRAIGGGIGRLPQTVWRGLDASSRMMGGPRLAQIGDALSTSLRETRNLYDLYRNLISYWPDPEAIVAGGWSEPRSGIDAAMPRGFAIGSVGSEMMVRDMRGYLPDDILCKLDRAAMFVGLETRAPFLDLEILGLAARLPPAMRFRGGKGKWALREVLAKYVPLELTDRPKMGFSVPVGEWLRGPLRGWADDLLSPASLRASGLLEPAPITRAWEQHRSGRFDWSNRLWSALMLEAWHRQYH